MEPANFLYPPKLLGDPSIVGRVLDGVPLVIFSSKPLFELWRSDDVGAGEWAAAIRRVLPNASVLHLPGMDAEEEVARVILAIRERTKNRQPVIVFAQAERAAYRPLSASALDGDAYLNLLFQIDWFESVMLPSSIWLAHPGADLAGSGPALPPLTPIEESLLRAMISVGLDVQCQVEFAPYTVDFLVSSGAKRLAVEADGAAFHNPVSDAARDKLLAERYGLNVVRFSGSRIHRNASWCAERAREELASQRPAVSFAGEGMDELDPSQKAAVSHDGGHARVLAPAGSGKTKVLVNRIVRLVNDGVPLEAILALAFNKKAADQLEGRLAALGITVTRGGGTAPGVFVSTFNAFGHRLIAREASHAYDIVSGSKERSLVADAVKQAGYAIVPTRGADPLGSVIAALAKVRRGLEAPSNLKVEVPQRKETAFIPMDAVWTTLRSMQEQRRLLTFDDQIMLAVELLLQTPELRRIWQNRFEHVLVDEYQDLNAAQTTLLRALTAGRLRLFAVGDDDQLIYSWRGANSAGILADFGRCFPDASDYALSVNYRCPKQVVRASQRLIAHNKNRYPKSITPAPLAPTGTLEVYRCAGLRAMGSSLVGFLNEQRALQGANWRGMAVIARTKSGLIGAALSLDLAGIPRRPLPDVRIYSTPVAKALLGYMEFALDPLRVSGDAAQAIVNRPNRYVRNEDVERIGASFWPWLVLDQLAFSCPSAQYRPGKARVPISRQLGDLLAVGEELWALAQDTAITASDLIDAILAKVRLIAPVRQGMPEEDDDSDEILLHLIREEARDWAVPAEFLVHARNRARQELSGDGFRSNAPQAETEEDRDEVTLATIHTSKGKEWPVVALFDASAPATNLKSAEHETEEERRIFYVAVTRATAALAFLYASGRPSPFASEALIPKGLAGADAEKRQNWKQHTEKELAARREEIAAIEGQVSLLLDRASALRSGRAEADLRARAVEVRARLDTLRRNLDNLLGERPTGPITRMFRRGYSSSNLVKMIASVEAAISEARQEAKHFAAQVDRLREEFGHELESGQSEIERLRVERLRAEAQLETLHGELSDYARVKNMEDLFDPTSKSPPSSSVMEPKDRSTQGGARSQQDRWRGSSASRQRR